MKKILWIGLLILSSILIMGCGSSDSKDDNKETSSVENVLKKSEVAFNAPKEIDFTNKTNMRLKRVQKLYKTSLEEGKRAYKEVISCDIAGNYTLERDNTGTTYIYYSDCIYTNKETNILTYVNGTVAVSRDKTTVKFLDFEEIPDINYDATGTYTNIEISFQETGSLSAFFLDGRVEDYAEGKLVSSVSFSKLLIKREQVKEAWFMKGGFSYKEGCLSENHIYDTDPNNWLIEHDANSDFWKSGTLYVDNYTYKYSGENVTVYRGEKQGTFSQQELLDEIENKRLSDSCSL